MILNYSNYSKVLESRYKAENIDKKYYVCKSNNRVSAMAVIEIISIINGIIKYKIVKRTVGHRDFFTNNDYSDWSDTYKISLSYWKRNMYSTLLFSTNDKDDAISFYDTYDDVKKYNL